MVTRLNEIAEAYENDIFLLLKHLLNINLLIECRQLRQASDEAMQGIDLTQKKSYRLNEMHMQSLKTLIHLLMKDMEEAGKSLDKANRIRPAVMAVPYQLSFFYRSQFEYYLCLMEDSLGARHRKEFSEYRKKGFTSGKMLLKNCQKAAMYRTESYRLWGVYNWLIQDRKNAFRWWHKALSEGERLGARPQVARTYAEIGKRLCPVEGKSSAPDLSRAKEILQKAQTMFRDLGLHQDLEDLDSFSNKIGLELSQI